MKQIPTELAEAELCDRFERALCSEVITEVRTFGSTRVLSADWVVRIGDTPFLLNTRSGQLDGYRRGLPLLCSSDFSINGSIDAWAALWTLLPPAGWHDVFALSKRGEMYFEGDMSLLMAHLQYVKDFLTIPRYR
ncbi:hypothetical protein KVP09_00255 [Alcaligenaceae bacterium CGII-47]|nr:hypothetical protein [Alcaligenaceae bacterium CGII-47]